MSNDAPRKILEIASLLHNRMTTLKERALLCDCGLAQDIENCKLDLANKITAVVLELQLEAIRNTNLEHPHVRHAIPD